jgi:hypothetical protein
MKRFTKGTDVYFLCPDRGLLHGKVLWQRLNRVKVHVWDTCWFYLVPAGKLKLAF